MVAVARRAELLIELQDEVGKGLETVALDMELAESVEYLASAETFDVAIANVGRGLTVMPCKTTYADIDSMMRVNLLSAMNTVAGCSPAMVAARKGTIVLVGSILGRIPYAPWRAAYNAAKAALAAMAVGWRQELSREGVRVLLFNPGLTSTDFQSSANPKHIATPQLEGRARSFPSVRAQSADEVAHLLLDAVRGDSDEVYTRAETAEWVAEYYAAIARGNDSVGNLLL